MERKLTPMHATCDKCDAPATVQLTDTVTGTQHSFCREHEPGLPFGERSPRLIIKRWRMPPAFSQRLAEPSDSIEHKDLHWEMCEAKLLGGEGACRYYLSIITGIDQFNLWNDEFLSNVREFLVSRWSHVKPDARDSVSR